MWRDSRRMADMPAMRVDCELYIGVEEGGQLRFGHRTHLGRGDLAVLEQHQCRNATNPIFRRDGTVLVDIDFHDVQAALVFAGDFVQDRRNHAAGAAPFSPVVDEHWGRGFEDVLVEGGVGGVFDEIAHMNSRLEGASMNGQAQPLEGSIEGLAQVNLLYLTPNSHFWQGAAHRIAAWLRQISISAADLTILFPQAIHQPLFRQAWLEQASGPAVLPQLFTMPQLLALLEMQKAQPPRHAGLQALELALRLQGDAYLPLAYQGEAQLPSRLVLAQDVLRLREHLAQADSDQATWAESGSGHGSEDGAWLLQLARQGETSTWRDQAKALDAWCASKRGGALVFVLAEPPDARQQWLLGVAQRHRVPVLLLQVAYRRGFGLALAQASACSATPREAAPADPSRQSGASMATGLAGTTPQRFPVRAARLFAARVQWCAGETLEAQAQSIVGLCLRRRDSDPDARIAIIALDRRLTRRVNALLSRLGMPVRDEAGWRLSTTRAAASLQTVLDAWPENPDSDAVLDLLKQAGVAEAAGLGAGDLIGIETEVRAARLIDTGAWRAWARQQPPAVSNRHSMALDHVTRALLGLRQMRGRQSVASWSQGLRSALEQLGIYRAWEADAAGQQLLALLAAQDDAQPLARAVRVDVKTYQAWLRQTVEAAVFRPTPVEVGVDDEGGTPIHVLALHDALLRPWDLCVLAGADADNFPAVADAPGRLGDQVCAQIGLPVRAQRRELAIQTAVVLALGSKQLAVFEAPSRPDHPGPSPLLQLWRWALGDHLAEPQVVDTGRWSAARAEAEFHQLAPHAAPCAPADIPARWSPSAYADLRACPYRFFARRVLRLGEDDDLMPDYSKRDFGNTLHRILERFHREDPGESPQDHREQLDRIAAADWEGAGALAEPFAAVWPAVRDNYVDWLQSWRAQGWKTLGEEQAMARVIDQTDADTSLHLEGRIDRIDRRGVERFALDYKTGNPQALKSRMQRLGEDTQLLCYALLLGADAPQDASGDGTAQIGAGYLVVSERRDPEHTDPAVELMWPPDDLRAQATLLAEQMRQDWRALRTGHAMPALGEPPVCDHCEARGLCRRDHRPAEDALALAQKENP